MSKRAVLDYFYGKEAEQFAFFTVPKILFKDPRYKDLQCEAKMLYGMMLDRMSLSIANGWFDEEKRAFIRISEEFITENLGCGHNKALNCLKQLENYGLIERVKHGQGKTSTIYVKKFIMQEYPDEELELVEETGEEKERPTDTNLVEKQDMKSRGTSNNRKNSTGEYSNSVIEETDPETESTHSDSYLEKSSSPDEQNRIEMEEQLPVSDIERQDEQESASDFLKFKNQTSRSLKIKHQEVYFSNPNNTKYNNTDSINTKSNRILSPKEDPEPSQTMRCDSDATDNLQGYSALIRKNIALDDLLIRFPYEREEIEGIYDLILEIVMCQGDSILISSNWYPMSLVKSKFLKLNYSDICYAMECLNKNTSKVKNIKKYMLAVLFNAHTTMDSYYKAAVNHDMAHYG